MHGFYRRFLQHPPAVPEPFFRNQLRYFFHFSKIIFFVYMHVYTCVREKKALSWLIDTRVTGNQICVPSTHRLPKSSQGRGGYAAAFRALGWHLRQSDLRSGRYHVFLCFFMFLFLFKFLY